MEPISNVDVSIHPILQKIKERAVCILNALIEYFMSEQMTENCFEAVRSTVVLLNSIQMHLRLNESSFLKCIDIDDFDHRNLLRSGIRSIDAFFGLVSQRNDEVREFHGKDFIFEFWEKIIF